MKQELHVLIEEYFKLIPRNNFVFSSVIEVAMTCNRNDEEFLILWYRVWFANSIITFCLTSHHILVSILSEVA